MASIQDAYTRYREGFPSTEFLHKHFGKSIVIKGNRHRGEIDTDLHTGLRHLFEEVLRSLPKHMIGTADNPEQVFIFKNGVPAPWIDSALESSGLMKELTQYAFLELCREFIGHCQAGAFHEDAWWRWRTNGDSIWIEKVPGAVRQRRTLTEVLGKTK